MHFKSHPLTLAVLATLSLSFGSAVANESTDLLLTLGDSDDAEKKTAASTITKVVSWNDAWVSTFGDYAKTATVKLTGTEAVNKIIVSENGALTNERTVELSNAGILVKGGSLINRGTHKDKDKAKRKARVNFGSVELLDGAHFSQSKNALDSGDSMTIGKGAKMDVAGLSTWQTVTLKVGCCFRRCACKL